MDNMKMEDFGDAEQSMFNPKPAGNKFLFSPYGTKNSAAFKKEGGIILSPSGISKFFTNPKEWYEDRTGIPTFDGNTNTVLGNAIHAYIESVFAGTPITLEEIEFWIDEKYGMNPKVVKQDVLKDFPNMARSWLNNFYKPSMQIPEMIEVEMEIIEHDADGLKIGTFGTADAVYVEERTLVDWKTCGRKPNKIGDYKYQLMQYARALKKKGVEIEYIQIVYIQRPLKSGVSSIYVFKQKITPQDWISAEYYAELMVNTLLLVHKNPLTKDLVFRENPIALY